MIRKLPIIPTFVVVAAMAVMVKLGFWQLDRLDQKEAMIARYQDGASNAEMLSSFPGDDPLAHLYRRTPFTCEKVARWSAIAGRNSAGVAGNAHVAQCVAADGKAVSVDVIIGWSRDPADPDWSGGEVTGIIAPVGNTGWRIVADPPLAGLDANARPDPKDLPNNHLAYAVQWFFFAVVAGVIYLLAVRKKLRDGGK